MTSDAYRDRVRARVGQSEPTVDAYPDAPDEPPRFQLILIAVEEALPVDAERVDTDGLSVDEFIPGLATDSRRRWLAQRTVAAYRRLLDRIGPAPESE